MSKGDISEGVHHMKVREKRVRTNGTPAKFQKITMKPHLKESGKQERNSENWTGLLFVVHVPCLWNAFFSFGTECTSDSGKGGRSEAEISTMH
jgi:hypothetical protein